MNSTQFDQAVESICRKDARFAREAYFFLREALDFTMRRAAAESGGSRHVSGQELLGGFRDYALQEFGPMAATVMREWGLSCGYHVGEMVFALISEDVFAKEESDSPQDFKKFQSFREAFEKPYEPIDPSDLK